MCPNFNQNKDKGADKKYESKSKDKFAYIAWGDNDD